MKYNTEIESLLEKLHDLEKAQDNRISELKTEEKETNAKIEEVQAAMQESLSAEAIGMPVKTPLVTLEKQRGSLQERLSKILSMIPIVAKWCEDSMREETRKLGAFFTKNIQPKMLEEAKQQQENVIKAKARYMLEVQKLAKLQNEQKALHQRIGHAFYKANIAEEAPRPNVAIEVEFKNGWKPYGNLSGVTEQEIRHTFATAQIDSKLAKYLK